jgi:putative nucleotidyltransferase with HDIG domain
MTMTQCDLSAPAALPLDEITARVRQCMRLPALSSTNSALRELLDGEHSYTQQVSDVIRRDPTLTSRLLRLVNTVYYGLPKRITSIEQAVFYLGIRQVRQLALVTPVIEEFQLLTAGTPFTWKLLWQHCIGTAMIANELYGMARTAPDETPYVAGLLHDMGKILMASAFPKHFRAVRARMDAGETDLLAVEREVLGADHAEIGAIYLEHHHLPPVLVATARFHHRPEDSTEDVVAAVHIADLLIRSAKIGSSGNPAEVTTEACADSPAWTILCPTLGTEERTFTRASLNRTLARLPMILEGLV